MITQQENDSDDKDTLSNNGVETSLRAAGEQVFVEQIFC